MRHPTRVGIVLLDAVSLAVINLPRATHGTSRFGAPGMTWSNCTGRRRSRRVRLLCTEGSGVQHHISTAAATVLGGRAQGQAGEFPVLPSCCPFRGKIWDTAGELTEGATLGRLRNVLRFIPGRPRRRPAGPASQTEVPPTRRGAVGPPGGFPLGTAGQAGRPPEGRQ